MNGSRYIHFCYYCDFVNDRTSALSGSFQMMPAATCTHDYQQMVSAGERHWLKCTSCYKVIEAELSNNVFYNYIESSDSYTAVSCTDDPASLSIPLKFNNKSVTSIASYAFAGCSALTTITIPNSIKEIGSYAFYGCTSLTSFTIPASVTSVGVRVFEGVANLSIKWNYNPALTAVFFNEYLTTVNFPSGTTTISANAFLNCVKLESFTIPASVTNIGNSAFKDCYNLKTVMFPTGFTAF